MGLQDRTFCSSIVDCHRCGPSFSTRSRTRLLGDSRLDRAVRIGLCLLLALMGSLTSGCYVHHQNGGFHRDFAWNRPEHSSGGRDRNRRFAADLDSYHVEYR